MLALLPGMIKAIQIMPILPATQVVSQLNLKTIPAKNGSSIPEETIQYGIVRLTITRQRGCGLGRQGTHGVVIFHIVSTGILLREDCREHLEYPKKSQLSPPRQDRCFCSTICISTCITASQITRWEFQGTLPINMREATIFFSTGTWDTTTA